MMALSLACSVVPVEQDPFLPTGSDGDVIVSGAFPHLDLGQCKQVNLGWIHYDSICHLLPRCPCKLTY
jgi:hypothetical protein